MKRIGIDARLLQETGPGRYLRNLIENLGEIDRHNEYFILLLKKDLNLKTSKNFHKVEADFRWYTMAEQIELPKLLKKYNLDLVHFPHFNVPILYSGKFVVTIHDLIHQHHSLNRSSTHSLPIYQLKKLAYRKAFSTALKKSQKILTVSEFVKTQLIDEWKINSDKIMVTYEGVEEKFFKKFKSDLNIKPPFILYIGNAHPHKNVEGLIKAFLNLRKSYQYLSLVLIGPNNFFWDRIKQAYNQKDIHFTGPLSDPEYIGLLRGATCLVQPSFEEGFGLPLLEAMAAEVPIVSSKAGSLPEIGGQAAVYFDPTNLEEMENKVSSVLNNQKLRQELINQGKDRVKQFSWKKMAEQTRAVYLEI